MSLNLIELASLSKKTKNIILGLSRSLLSLLQIKKNLNIIITSESYIKKINYQYRGLNKPTDVLAFAYNDDDLLGELFLCLSQNTKKAKMGKEHPTERLKMIIIHGFLHLLGYDHNTKSEERLMDKKAKQLFNQLSLSINQNEKNYRRH